MRDARGEREVDLREERLYADLVDAAEDLVDREHRLGAVEVLENPFVDFLDGGGHFGGRLLERGDGLGVERHAAVSAHEVEVVPGAQEECLADDTVLDRLAQAAVRHAADDRVGAVDTDVAVLEVVHRQLRFGVNRPLLKHVDVARLVRLGIHRLGGDVAQIPDAAQVFEVVQCVVGIHEARLGILLGLVEVVARVESVGRFVERAGGQQRAGDQQMEYAFHVRLRFRSSGRVRWCTCGTWGSRPSRCRRVPLRGHTRRSG